MLMLFKDWVLTIPWWITATFCFTLISLVLTIFVLGILLVIMTFEDDL